MYQKIILTLALLTFFILTSCSNDDDQNDDGCIKKEWYQDNDGDGFGNSEVSQFTCNQPDNFVDNSNDIDDSNPNIGQYNIWRGDKIVFSKANNADWTLEENQDRITDNVWITRQYKKGIFNIFSETEYANNFSPENTEWTFGTTNNIEDLTFTSWQESHGGQATSIVNENMVLHIIDENVYIDIKFTAWTCCQEGGGFSYERSTNN